MSSSPHISVRLALIASAGIVHGCATSPPPESRGSTESHLTGNGIGAVRVTHYTLASEADFASEPDFLCSASGVAMQGTGIRNDGSYVAWASGGGGWCGDYLCDCGSARFVDTSAPTGASGRSVVKNYSIAVDPTVIPLDSYVWLDTLGQWFRADDTGGAIIGMHIDVYTADESPNLPESSDAFVTSEPHAAGDPGPNGEVANANNAVAATIAPRPDGDFAALDIGNSISGNEYIVQCTDSSNELVWLTTDSGKDSASRWAAGKYSQPVTDGLCGDPNGDGVYPLVLWSETSDALSGTWISQCSGDGVARVFKVDGSVDGHPTASYLYTQEDASCAQ